MIDIREHGGIYADGGGGGGGNLVDENPKIGDVVNNKSFYKDVRWMDDLKVEVGDVVTLYSDIVKKPMPNGIEMLPKESVIYHDERLVLTTENIYKRSASGELTKLPKLGLRVTSVEQSADSMALKLTNSDGRYLAMIYFNEKGDYHIEKDPTAFIMISEVTHIKVTEDFKSAVSAYDSSGTCKLNIFTPKSSKLTVTLKNPEKITENIQLGEGYTYIIRDFTVENDGDSFSLNFWGVGPKGTYFLKTKFQYDGKTYNQVSLSGHDSDDYVFLINSATGRKKSKPLTYKIRYLKVFPLLNIPNFSGMAVNIGDSGEIGNYNDFSGPHYICYTKDDTTLTLYSAGNYQEDPHLQSSARWRDIRFYASKYNSMSPNQGDIHVYDSATNVNILNLPVLHNPNKKFLFVADTSTARGTTANVTARNLSMHPELILGAGKFSAHDFRNGIIGEDLLVTHQVNSSQIDTYFINKIHCAQHRVTVRPLDNEAVNLPSLLVTKVYKKGGFTKVDGMFLK